MMQSETMNLGWGRFALQVGAALLAILGAYIGGEILTSGRELSRNHSIAPYFITYMMPGLFFLCHAFYSQYLRYKIARGETNAFSDGSKCK